MSRERGWVGLGSEGHRPHPSSPGVPGPCGLISEEESGARSWVRSRPQPTFITDGWHGRHEGSRFLKEVPPCVPRSQHCCGPHPVEH